MSGGILARGDRTSPVAFWLGAIAVTIGVGLHLPMFFASASMGYMMAGMAMDPTMIFGMGLIVAGFAAAAYGLIPASRAEPDSVRPEDFAIPAGEAEGRLTPAHWLLMLTLTFALVIDTMKPASLGFVVPGMAEEYHLPRQVVALLPFFALLGTAIGSLIWGFLADLLGRRAAILLAAIMFIGTAICGAMPSFTWNLVMCFLMGISAGGMLPIAYTLLAELVPARHRGWFLVLLGGLGLSAGYLAAAGSAALLEPIFGWRIMWFLGLPTGVILIALNRFIPESPKFLLLRGETAQALAIMRRFKAHLAIPQWSCASGIEETGAANTSVLFRGPLAGISASVNLAALAWSLVNFGLLLWLPADLRARGLDVAASDVLLAQSSLVALPTAAIAAWLYARWSTKWTLVLLAALTAFGLLGVSLLGHGLDLFGNNPLLLIAILMVGSNGVIAVLLPYSAETYPLRVRGRGTGFVAGSSKLGGLGAQIAMLVAFVPGLTTAALILAVPMVLAACMIGRYGGETRERSLDEIDCRRPAEISTG